LDGVSELCFNPSSVSAVLPPEAAVPDRAWFCLRTQPKREHLATQHLELLGDVEVFNPRIRYTRRTRRGTYKVTESMFPNYLFARFDWRTAMNKVGYATGVSCIVHFGERYPLIPDQAIADLKEFLGEEEVRVIDNAPQPGETIELIGRAFTGLEAVVTQVLPGKDRVLVLMDFLGRQTQVEVPVTEIVRKPRA
jgi:transcriptional antiterminator RfaH